MAFVVCKVCDPERLQRLGVKGDGTPEITDCENNVVYQMLPLPSRCDAFCADALALRCRPRADFQWAGSSPPMSGKPDKRNSHPRSRASTQPPRYLSPAA